MKLVDLLNQNELIFCGVYFSKKFDSINNPEKLNSELEKFAKEWRKNILHGLNSFDQKKSKLFSAPGFNLLKVSSFLYSTRIQNEVFEPIVAEWQFEYCEDLKNERFGRSKITNLRWTYHFLAAMIQKSPIGDLIELIRKFKK
ncbi:MAG: hypothetical protein ACR2IA_11465 [Pyrinomonadaceae bacterium]